VSILKVWEILLLLLPMPLPMLSQLLLLLLLLLPLLLPMLLLNFAIVPFINLMVPLVVSATLTIQAAAMMAPVIPPSIRQHQFLYELIHVVTILSTLTTFGTVYNSHALQGQPMMDMEMTGSVSRFSLGIIRSKKFSSTSTVDNTHAFVAHLKVKGNDQSCTLEKLLMDPTMLNVMAHSPL